MLFTDLIRVKKLLEIDPCDTREDVALTIFLETSSNWIEELLNRPGMSYKVRTEYYDGTGTPNLLLRSRPVFTSPTPIVYLDEGGHFGQRSGSFDSGSLLEYGVDYYLRTDQEDGTSRSAILTRISNKWPRRTYRETGYLSPFIGPSPGTVKVTYAGGYTVDQLPATLKMACDILVARFRNFFPLATELANESYENRYISYLQSRKDFLLSQVKDIIIGYRNWKW